MSTDAATLDEIDDAIMAALAPLLKANGGPFPLITRFFGDITNEEQVHAHVVNQSAFVLVSMDEEQSQGFDDNDDVRTLVHNEAQPTALSSWLMLVGQVVPVQSANAALKTRSSAPSTGPRGFYALHSLVVSKLSELHIPGLFQATSLRYISTTDGVNVHGKIVSKLLTFQAKREIEQAIIATNPDTTAFGSLVGGVRDDHQLPNGDPVPVGDDALAEGDQPLVHFNKTIT